jgi:hypothetical protein
VTATGPPGCVVNYRVHRIESRTAQSGFHDEGVTVSQQGVGECPSVAALVASVPAFVTLDGVFLESCPAYDGSLTAEGGETVESVPTVVCEDCGAVVF